MKKAWVILVIALGAIIAFVFGMWYFGGKDEATEMSSRPSYGGVAVGRAAGGVLDEDIVAEFDDLHQMFLGASPGDIIRVTNPETEDGENLLFVSYTRGVSSIVVRGRRPNGRLVDYNFAQIIAWRGKLLKASDSGWPEAAREFLGQIISPRQ